MLSEFAGWGGCILMLAAFFCVSVRTLKPQSLFYQGLDTVGSFCWHGIPSCMAEVLFSDCQIMWLGISIGTVVLGRRGRILRVEKARARTLA